MYVIESVRNKDGSPHERLARRKGHRVNIVECRIGNRLLYEYPDDNNAFVRTSSVENVLVGDGNLVVWTCNTEYRFRKEDEVTQTDEITAD